MNRILAMLSLAVLAFGLQAQTTPSQATKLRVAIKGAELLFTWEAPSDAPGGWAIWKSPEPFSTASFAQASRIGDAAPSARSWTYSAPDQKPAYYALLALDASGKPVQQFLAGKTMTAVAISSEAPPVAATTSAGAASSAGTTTAAGKGGSLSVMAAKDSVQLSFSGQPSGAPLLIYRSQNPFTDSASLLEANLVASVPPETRSFIDYPIPGTSYYYALVPEPALRTGAISFNPGSTTIAQPVQIGPTARVSTLPETGSLARVTPLPSWVFAKKEGFEGRPGDVELSPESEKAIASILAAYPAQKPRTPPLLVLEEDRGQARGGEDYALSLIIQGPLKKGEYATAIEQLQGYLSFNRSPSVASRAHFYLGESFAMSGMYRDAFFEFLQARSYHPTEVRPWVVFLVAAIRAN